LPLAPTKGLPDRDLPQQQREVEGELDGLWRDLLLLSLEQSPEAGGQLAGEHQR
jgi:hypothetical protein